MKYNPKLNVIRRCSLAIFALMATMFMAAAVENPEGAVMALIPAAFLVSGKLNEDGRKRYNELAAKADEELTADERTELLELKAQVELEDGGEKLTDAQVEELVQKSLGKALHDAGLSTTNLIAEIKKAGNGDGVKASDIEEIVKKHAGNKVESAVIIAELKKAMPTQLTEEKVTALFDAAVKNIRSEQKMEHGQHGEIDFPIAHRSGNLSVAQKQLLNVCLIHSGADLGASRPKHINEGITERQLSKAQASGERVVKNLRQAIRFGGHKALTTSGTGVGLELMDSDLASDLLSRFYMESELASELLGSEIQMPTNPFTMPMTTTLPNFYVTGETQSALETSIGTAAPTLNAKKLTGMVPYSYEADEDSIVAILPMLQDRLGQGAAIAFEGAVINGDVTATHFDSDIAAVTRHHAKLFRGLRKMVTGTTGIWTSMATGGVSAANVGAIRKLLNRFGMRPADLLLIVGNGAYNDLVMLEQTLTQDKVGNNARINTGVATNIFGIRIVPSSACREDLNAAGVYDGITTNKGVMLLMHRPSFMVGVRRGFTVEVDVDKKAQVNYVIASFRRDFIPIETPSAAQPLVAGGYNYTA